MFKDFLEKIQNAEESVKKRWLVFSSAIVMFVIIAIWIKYFAFIVQPMGGIGGDNLGTREEFSFGDTMKIGISVIWAKLSDFFQAIGRMLYSPRNYIIKP